MVQHSVNQAINDKKMSLKYKNPCLRSRCDIKNTYKSSGMCVRASVSPIQAAIRTFQISPLKMNNKFQGFHPILFGQASMK